MKEKKPKKDNDPKLKEREKDKNGARCRRK